MNKKISIGLAITLALIAMTVTFSITFVLSQQRFTVTMNSVREREQIYSKLAEIDKYVRDNYYGEIDDQKLYDMLGAGYILGIDDPNATYYVHQKEMEYVTGPLMRFHTYAQHYNFRAVEKLLHLQFAGKVKLIEKDCENVLDGVQCLRTGGHTPGLVSVAVSTQEGTKVICGDVIPRWQNVTDTTPCGIHYDVTEALLALEKVGAAAGCLENILPGHDPAITERFREEAPGVYRIV